MILAFFLCLYAHAQQQPIRPTVDHGWIIGREPLDCRDCIRAENNLPGCLQPIINSSGNPVAVTMDFGNTGKPIGVWTVSGFQHCIPPGMSAWRSRKSSEIYFGAVVYGVTTTVENKYESNAAGQPVFALNKAELTVNGLVMEPGEVTWRCPTLPHARTSTTIYFNLGRCF